MRLMGFLLVKTLYQGNKENYEELKKAVASQYSNAGP
jgi:hypothetical protein